MLRWILETKEESIEFGFLNGPNQLEGKNLTILKGKGKKVMNTL